MNREFDLGPLPAGRILQAYPLIRDVAPDVTIEAWRGYARRAVRPRQRNRRGIVAAYSGTDYLRGLFAYRVGPDMVCGRAIIIEVFAVGSMFVPDAVADALLAGIETLALEHGCGIIRAEMQARPDWLEDMLRARGFGRRVGCLCKPVTPPGRPGKPKRLQPAEHR